MALIKTDPSQTKTVVALVAVLLIAVVATVARIKPQEVAQAAAQTQQASDKAPTVTVSSWNSDATRNPFVKPQSIKAALDSAKTKTNNLLGGVERAIEPRANRFRMGESSASAPGIGPMGLPPMVQVRPSNQNRPHSTDTEAASTVEPERPKPAFALVATVRNKNGLCAVIRTGDAKLEVVETGDRLDGGYKVSKLETDFAVLTDGRDTIIAKRPQS